MDHLRTKNGLRLLAALLILVLLVVAAASTAYAQPGEICDNGLDDDGDRYIDSYDLDCAGPPCVRPLPNQRSQFNAPGNQRPGCIAVCHPRWAILMGTVCRI